MRSRIFSALMALVLAVGLAPVPAFADEPVSVGSSDGAASAATDGASGSDAADASEPAVAYAADAGDASVEGQALVLYRVEGADASSRARGLAANADDAAPLARAGVSVEQTWDFSAVDQAVASAPYARSANALDASAADEAAQTTLRGPTCASPWSAMAPSAPTS